MRTLFSASMALAYPEVPALVLGSYIVFGRHRPLGLHFRVEFQVHRPAGFQNPDSTHSPDLRQPGRYLRVGAPGSPGGPCPQSSDTRRLPRQHKTVARNDTIHAGIY